MIVVVFLHDRPMLTFVHALVILRPDSDEILSYWDWQEEGRETGVSGDPSYSEMKSFLWGPLIKLNSCWLLGTTCINTLILFPSASITTTRRIVQFFSVKNELECLDRCRYLNISMHYLITFSHNIYLCFYVVLSYLYYHIEWHWIFYK